MRYDEVWGRYADVSECALNTRIEALMFIRGTLMIWPDSNFARVPLKIPERALMICEETLKS